MYKPDAATVLYSVLSSSQFLFLLPNQRDAGSRCLELAFDGEPPSDEPLGRAPREQVKFTRNGGPEA